LTSHLAERVPIIISSSKDSSKQSSNSSNSYSYSSANSISGSSGSSGSRDSNLSSDRNVTVQHLNYSQSSPSLSGGGGAGLSAPMRNKENRPVSAQRRRPSIPSLDAIPENRSMIHRIVDSDNEIDLMVADVDGVFTSSFDSRFPTSNINIVKCHFLSSSMSPVEEDNTPVESSPLAIMSPKKSPKGSSSIGGGGGGASTSNCNFWISTGLVPQFMMITLREKWIFRKLEIRCNGVKSMTVMFDNYQTEVRKINENLFVLETTELSAAELRGIAFKRLTININEITGPFFSVISLGIKALAYA
jgi:hypothetical protein